MHLFLPNLIQTIDELQRVQNAAARLVTLTPKFEHIIPILQSLHWLPIAQRVEYKILLLTFKQGLTEQAPKYLQDLLQVSNQSRSHRYNNQNLLLCPHSRTVRYGDRSFPVAVSSLWNKHPQYLRDCDSVTGFKSQLIS